MNRIFSKTRQFTLVILLLLIPAGIFTKYYNGPGGNWVNNSLGGIFYVIFWSLVFYLFRPRTRPVYISLIVFILTSLVELTQLLHTPWLESLRSVTVLRWLFGHTFHATDFIYYALGSLLAYLIMSGLNRAQIGFRK